MTTVDNDSGLVLSDVEVTEFFGDKPIRWYQKACREGIIKALNDGIKRVIVVLPTGAGKTITVACSMSDQRVRDILDLKCIIFNFQVITWVRLQICGIYV